MNRRLICGAVVATAIVAAGCQNSGQVLHDIWYKPIYTIPNTIVVAIRGIDPQQQAVLQQNSPETVKKLQNNDGVVQQQVAPQTQNLMPLTVDDIEALAVAGVKDDVVISEIQTSNTKFSQKDIGVLQQAGIHSAVLDYIKSSAS